MKAVTESTPAAPAPRDVLAGLLHQVLVAPNQGTRSLADRCATVAITFCHLDDREIREKSLVKALSRALSIVEMTDLPEAIDIVGALEGDLALLTGAPIVLDCTPPLIRPLIEVEEGDIAISTLQKFNKERQPLVVDLGSPENMGGRWLRKPRRKPKN